MGGYRIWVRKGREDTDGGGGIKAEWKGRGGSRVTDEVDLKEGFHCPGQDGNCMGRNKGHQFGTLLAPSSQGAALLTLPIIISVHRCSSPCAAAVPRRECIRQGRPPFIGLGVP